MNYCVFGYIILFFRFPTKKTLLGLGLDCFYSHDQKRPVREPLQKRISTLNYDSFSTFFEVIDSTKARMDLYAF